MLENATNLTTVTSNSTITIALILQYLTLFGVIGSFLVGGIISMLKYLANVTSDITLIPLKNKKSSCKYSDNPIWLRHFFARIVVRIFTPWKKYDKSIEKWKESFDIANNELSSRVNEIEKYKSPDYDYDTREFIESKDKLISALEKTISNNMKGDLRTAKSKIRKDSDGRCTILCGGRLVAYSYSYDKAKKIENSLRDIIEDENVKELIKKRYTDYQEMSRLEQLFKIKLAWGVGIIRMWDSILPFKQTKEYGDLNG